MKSSLIIIGLLIAIVKGIAQPADSVPAVDLVEIVIKKLHINFHENKRAERKVHFSLFPTQGGVPGGRAVVTSFNAAFYLGEKSSTRVSSVYFIPYITFSGKYGFLMRTNLWLPGNTWSLAGDYRILKYPQSTWGLGGSSEEGTSTEIDNSYFRFYQTALKGIGGNWNVGAGYMLDHHFNIAEMSEGNEGYLNSYPTGTDRETTSSGLFFPLAYDARGNSINPQGGAYALAGYRFNTPALGSDHTWHSLYIDGRKYFSFSDYRQNILAFRSYYWTVLSGQVPYLDLPAIGWDLAIIPSGRGIEQGRYRSNALLYFESEYRFDITANGLLGAVVFSNVSSASEYETQNFQSWRGAIGTGFRIKFNKYSRTNILFDFAASKDYMAVYLNIGEAF